MRRTPIIAAMVALVPVFCCTPASAQGCELIYKWEQGETIATRLTIEQERTVGPMSGSTESENGKKGRRSRPDDEPEQPRFMPIEYGTSSRTLVCDFDIHTIEVDQQGAAAIEMTIRNVAATADLPQGEKFIFDSTKKHKPGQQSARRAQTLADLVGKSMTMRIGRDGQVLESLGVDALVEAMNALQDDDALGAVMLDTLRRGGEQRGMDEMFTMCPRMLPGKPVHRGESWKTEVEHTLPIAGRIRTIWNSTLQSLRGSGKSQIATIESEASIDIRPIGAGMPGIDGLPPGVSLEFQPGAGKATTKFDVIQGRATEAEMELDLKVGVCIGQPGIGAIDGVMQTLKCRMKHELIEDRTPRTRKPARPASQ